MDISNKSTKDILTEIKLMEIEFSNTKHKISSLLDNLDIMEKKYSLLRKELDKRSYDINKHDNTI